MNLAGYRAVMAYAALRQAEAQFLAVAANRECPARIWRDASERAVDLGRRADRLEKLLPEEAA